MNRDLENATKAAQCAALLVADLRDLLKTDNPLLADIALSEVERAAEMQRRLERLQANLEIMPTTHVLIKENRS